MSECVNFPFGLTSGAMKAMVPRSWPWNSPAPVPLEASLAAAPKSAIRSLWPVLSISKLAPFQDEERNIQKYYINANSLKGRKIS